MRVAICFYGLVGSVSDKDGNGSPLNPEIGFKYFENNILNVNDSVDVFIHSWSVGSRDQLISTYKPENYIIENQVSFPNAKNHPEISKGIRRKIKMVFFKMFKNEEYRLQKKKREKESFRAHSRWYSVKKSIQLMKDYEIENNFEYDCVMSTRLDVAFFKPLVFDKFDLNYFYASHWNDAAKPNENIEANYLNHHKGRGFLDFWFFSNSSLMFEFSKLYDIIERYPISPHFSSRKHIDTLTNKIKFVFYRWYDHEMIRRKFFNSKK